MPADQVERLPNVLRDGPVQLSIRVPGAHGRTTSSSISTISILAASAKPNASTPPPPPPRKGRFRGHSGRWMARRGTALAVHFIHRSWLVRF